MTTLPKLNSAPKYTLVIPSTKKKIRYRPYLIKEEKVLLLAMESEDTREIFNSILDTIDACVQDDVDRASLTTFDVEYMFLKLRSKSVGEKASVGIKCEKCENVTPVEINLEDVVVTTPDLPNKIELGEYLLEVKWPSYNDVANIDKDASQSDQTFATIRSTLVALHTNDERILFEQYEDKDIDEFIESMNRSQFEQLNKFIESIPTVQTVVEFKCEKCLTDNTKKLQGMQDFFSYA